MWLNFTRIVATFCHHSTPKPNSNSPEPEPFSPAPAPQHCGRAFSQILFFHFLIRQTLDLFVISKSLFDMGYVVFSYDCHFCHLKECPENSHVDRQVFRSRRRRRRNSRPVPPSPPMRTRSRGSSRSCSASLSPSCLILPWPWTISSSRRSRACWSISATDSLGKKKTFTTALMSSVAEFCDPDT